MSLDDNNAKKIVLQNVGWEIINKISQGPNPKNYLWAIPICKSCQIDLPVNNQQELCCDNPRCKQNNKVITLDTSLLETQRLVVRMYQADIRKQSKTKWYNYDQQLVALSETEAKHDRYWCAAKFYDTKSGPELMVLVGLKHNDQKVQFFIKDKLNLITFDDKGAKDLHPNNIFMSFTAKFSDGSITNTAYSNN